MPETITSRQNPRIKQVRRLRDRSERDASGRFVIDSLRDLHRAIACGYEVDYVLVVPGKLRGTLPTLPERAVFHVTSDMLDAAAYRENPDGLVAVMIAPKGKGPSQLADIVDSPILSLVSLTKPGNIGALLRTADAAGFQSVFLVDSLLDLYNPNVIRSSTGAVFLGNIYELSSEQAREFFKTRGYQLIAAHLNAAKSAYSVNYSQKCTLLLGTEDTGLDESWLPFCDEQILIPMVGKLADSLNVSVAGAVLMYEVLRQLSGRVG